MKKLAIIGAKSMARNYAVNAREMGVETHCFAWPQGAMVEGFVDHFHPISVFEVDHIIAECRRIGVNGVVATTELTIATAAQVAEAIGLNGISVDVAKRITDKFQNRKLSQEVAGLSHPKCFLVDALEDVKGLDLSYPVILKPTAEGGKRGVTVVGSADMLAEAFSYAKKESKAGGRFVIEEFLAGGVECSVETLSYHGKHYVIQVTEKISSGPPHCAELGHIQPARILPETRIAIEQAVCGGLSAIGYTNGPCHTEVKVIDGRVYLIEFNARPGGDFISYPLVDLSTGYSLLKGAISIALDDFVPPEDNLFKSSAGVCFVTDQTPLLIPMSKGVEKKPWCWRKNEVGEVVSLQHNNGNGTNYFIWQNQYGLPDELKGVL